MYVRGIGWITKSGYGCIKTKIQHPLSDDQGGRSLGKEDIFAYPFKNFGRLDRISRMTACAASLALRDAGIEYAPSKKLDIGIIGTNSEGSLRSDMAYFKDYIQGGRTLSRANLFIYTLPSSPLGEAAIHFGFTGPLLYASAAGSALAMIMDMVGDMFAAREASMMLGGQAEENEAVYFLFSPVKTDEDLCEADTIKSLLEQKPDIPHLVQALLLLNNKKGAA